MTSFLQQVASAFYQRYGSTIHRLTFVFPNQRSGLFFRKYLSQLTQKPLFSPTILTINELFIRLSDKQPADRIRMLFLLYRIYIRHSRSDERFDDFVFWGDMLLNDFNDIDKYLVDAAHLFSNIKDIHQIDRDFNYLQPEQIEAIRTFWSSFQPKGLAENRQNFLDIWQHLHDIYQTFKQELATEGTGYEGMIFREVIEQLKEADHQKAMIRQPVKKQFEKIVFVGLNALSPAEKALLKILQQQGIADFYWDSSSECLTDPNNKASYFIREHLKMFPSEIQLSEIQLPECQLSENQLPEAKAIWPEIELIGVSSRIGQAKQVYAILKETLAGRTSIDPEEALQTAIVLPDEQLLIPVLHAIPEEFKHINVTLGYPLSNAPIASLMESIFDLQQKIRRIDEKVFFYHREVLAILNHPYISTACPDEIAALIKEITEHNKVFISTVELNRSPLLTLIFQPVTDEEISDYLISILKELNKLITAQHGNAEKDENDAVAMGNLEQEFVYHYFITVNRLKEMIHSGEISMSVETFCRLLKRLIATLSIPFYGKPLSGIQVMGVLETRVLNFDRLIILSMNEGIFPAKVTAGSFIPYNLRRGFGLPVYEHQDSVWSYHFYRLIAGAKKVTLLYDTRTEGLQTGEVSRFVHQLKYQYAVPMKERLVVPDVTFSPPLAFRIEKTPEIISALSAYCKGGDKALSASTINTYLDCPLKFYFAVIEGLDDEEDEVSERVENNLFGSIFHRVAEQLYKPFCGSTVTADLLKIRAKEQLLTETIQQAFAELFFHSKEVRPLSGQHYLTGEMIRKYVLKLLEKDRELTPFRYIRSELKIQHPFVLSNGTTVQLKGFIDRVDEVDDRIRVIDYKTGSRKGMDFKSMKNIFDPADDKRQSAIMQIFMYACMYSLQDTSKPVQPALYYARDFFSNDFDPTIYQGQGKEKAPVHDFSVIIDEFTACLRTCLDRIFDPDIPFTQTSNPKICGYCPFAGVCGK